MRIPRRSGFTSTGVVALTAAAIAAAAPVDAQITDTRNADARSPDARVTADSLVAWGVAAGPEVDPGGVATVVLRRAVPPDADSLQYRVDPAAGVRLFAAGRGTRPVQAADTISLALTFGVPANARAGLFLAATVALDWGGRADTVPVPVRIRARRAIDFELSSDRLIGPVGKPMRIGYRLRNRGNATDTIRLSVNVPGEWRARVDSSRLVLAPGDTASGTIRALPPSRATVGREDLLSVVARTPHVSRTRTFRGVVVAEQGWIEGLAEVPGRVFVGSSTGFDRPGIALAAAGDVRPGTRVSIELREAQGFSPPPAFRGALSGPRLRLGIDAPSWGVHLGDVFTTTDVFTGPVVQGRGIQANATFDSLSADLTVARPSAYSFETEAGHVARGGAELGTAMGTFGVEAAAIRRASETFAPYATLGGGLTYWLVRAGHSVRARAGVLRVESDSGAVAGPAGEASYRYRSGKDGLSLRVRRVPAVTPRTSGNGNELFLSGSKGLGAGISATGWAFSSSSQILGFTSRAASKGASAGLRGQWSNRVTAQLLGSYRESSRGVDSIPRGVSRSIRGSVDVPAGPLTLELDADVGLATDASSRGFVQGRSGARWVGRGYWAWVGLAYHDLGMGAPLTSLDASGSFAAGRLHVQGGLNLRLDDPAVSGLTFWTAGTLPLADHGWELHVGVERRGSTLTDPWRFSLGISQRFGVPLPLPRRPALQGVVFEDLDGDRVRDPGEPALPDVRLVFGPLAQRTDGEGTFRFYDRMNGTLRVDPGSLPAGMVIPAEVVLPTRGDVAIPVIRTASLRLRLFLDRDGDEERDDAEEWGGGLVVSLIDSEGRARDGLTDEEGRLRFGGVVPGEYTLSIRRPAAGRLQPPPLEVPVTIRPGTDLEETIAVPLRAREIRIRGVGSG